MPSEVICPRCGLVVPIDLSYDPVESPEGGHAAQTVEMIVPTTASSHDELGASCLGPGAFEPEPVPVSSTLLHGEEAETDLLRTNSAESTAAAASGTPEGRGPGLGLVLLASYSSALTLAVLWLLLTGRLARENVTESDPIPTPPGLRADRSRTVAPAGPIGSGRSTTLGTPIRVGDLELTPIEVAAGPVILEHARVDGGLETREGGDAWRLRVRLRNTSDDAIFAPLDEAFLREPDRGLPPSFIELGPGDRIYMYPLAIESEWSIEGQEFRDLKPGESFETDIVAAADAPTVREGPATWRLRVRTGLDQVDTIGIGFDPGQVRTSARITAP